MEIAVIILMTPSEVWNNGWLDAAIVRGSTMGTQRKNNRPTGTLYLWDVNICKPAGFVFKWNHFDVYSTGFKQCRICNYKQKFLVSLFIACDIFVFKWCINFFLTGPFKKLVIKPYFNNKYFILTTLEHSHRLKKC